MIDAANRPMTLVPLSRRPNRRSASSRSTTKAPLARTSSTSRSRRSDGEIEDYLYFDDIRGLLACVQMGTIEFHGWGSKIDKVEYPDRLVFDLDPDVGLDFNMVKAAAVRLKALLEDLGLKSFPLLSGGKGIHVVVPLDQSKDWPTVKSFAERFSRAISEAEPKMFTANIRKVQRKDRIFLDWLRNQRGATAVMPYSARAREGAPVSAPVAWEELERYESGHHFSIRDADELLEARLIEDACRLGRGQASIAGCLRLAHRFRPSPLPSHRRLAARARPLARRSVRVTITRDDWGIAHVHGQTDADAVFGMIYAQAEDDFPRIEANYLTSLGRTAEAEGEKAIWQDLRARLYVSDSELKADYARSPVSMRN